MHNNVEENYLSLLPNLLYRRLLSYFEDDRDEAGDKERSRNRLGECDELLERDLERRCLRYLEGDADSFDRLLNPGDRDRRRDDVLRLYCGDGERFDRFDFFNESVGLGLRFKDDVRPECGESCCNSRKDFFISFLR